MSLFVPASLYHFPHGDPGDPHRGPVVSLDQYAPGRLADEGVQPLAQAHRGAVVEAEHQDLLGQHPFNLNEVGAAVHDHGGFA